MCVCICVCVHVCVYFDNFVDVKMFIISEHVSTSAAVCGYYIYSEIHNKFTHTHTHTHTHTRHMDVYTYICLTHCVLL